MEKTDLFHSKNAILKNRKTVILRLLNSSDSSALAEFYSNIPDDDYHFYCPHELNDQKACEKVMMHDKPNFVCIVAENENKQIVGYAWYTWENNTNNESVFGICVSRQYQGVRLGKSLMYSLIELAKTYGPPIMSLTVQLANSKAVSLYQQMGFHIIREQLRESDNEPEYYMELRLRQ